MNSKLPRGRVKDHALYFTWKSMKRRCLGKRHPDYPNYGGRGILIASDWLGRGGFWRFVDDVGPKPTPKHHLDRIDNDGPYSAANCRWVTVSVNARNRRNNRIVHAYGRSLCVAAWAELLSVSPAVIYSRIHRGMRGAEALPPFTGAGLGGRP